MDVDISNEIKNECIKRWGKKDEKIEEFQNNFDAWCLFSNDEEKKICLDLLKNFDYYSKQEVNTRLKEWHENLVEIFKVEPNDTIYTIIKNRSGRVNSSFEYFYEYIHINKINKYSRIEDINSINDEAYQHIQNIVIIDDCIGSGRTVKDYLTKYKEKLINKKIYLILIHLVVDFANELEDFAKENNYNLTILCRDRRAKAFGKEDDEFKQKFIMLSQDKQIPQDYILGESQVEALMAFYNNTPNNTLGIFWYETENNVPLFPRVHDEKPEWMLKGILENRNKRKKQNYINMENNL